MLVQLFNNDKIHTQEYIDFFFKKLETHGRVKIVLNAKIVMTDFRVGSAFYSISPPELVLVLFQFLRHTCSVCVQFFSFNDVNCVMFSGSL